MMLAKTPRCSICGLITCCQTSHSSWAEREVNSSSIFLFFPLKVAGQQKLLNLPNTNLIFSGLNLLRVIPLIIFSA